MTELKGHHKCPCGSGEKYRNCHGLATFVPGTEHGPGANRYGGSTERETGAMLHILMPSRGAVAIETMVAVSAVGWNKDEYARLGVARATFLSISRKGVAQAREMLAEAALNGMDAAPYATHYLLWVDDDAVFTVHDITMLLAELRRQPDLAAVSCYYSAKVKGHPGFVPRFPEKPGGNESALRIPGVDFQPHHVVEVPWIGLHLAIMRGEALRGMQLPRFPFDESSGCGEDVGFSHRLRDAGHKLAVHAGVMVAHIDMVTGERFIPDVGAERI